MCTQIGNDHFTWFATTGSKSRLNFLELLRAGHGDYVINEPPAQSGAIRRQAGEPPDPAPWRRGGLARPSRSPRGRRVQVEGAMWGSITDHGLLTGDRQRRRRSVQRRDIWVHADDPFPDRLHRGTARGARTDQGAGVVVLRRPQDPRSNRGRQSRRFDRIFTARTEFVTLDRLLARLHANKDERFALDPSRSILERISYKTQDSICDNLGLPRQPPQGHAPSMPDIGRLRGRS